MPEQLLDAVVCGLGPSIQEFRPRSSSTIFGVNDLDRLLSPDELIVVDPKRRFSPDRAATIESSKAKRAWLAQPASWNLRYASCSRLEIEVIHRPQDVSLDRNSIPQYQTSAFAAVALAYRLGYRRIGLVGVDFLGHPLARRISKLRQMFLALSAHIRTGGGDLVNLSPISMLGKL